MRLGDFGVLGVEGAAARPQQTGHVAGGASILYSYSADGFGLDLNYRRLQSGFLPTTTLLPQFVPLKDAGVQVSYSSPRFGTLTATATRSEFEDGSRQNSYTLRYNISPTVHWNIDATLGHVSGQGGAQSGVAVVLSVNFFFGDRTTATARVQRTSVNGTEYDVEVARPAPIGPGFGYRVDMQRSAGIYQVRPQVQLNTDKLEYTLGMSRLFGSGANATAVDASVAGAFAYVGGIGKFTRPIYDGFAITKTGALEGVTVRQNSRTPGEAGPRHLARVDRRLVVENRFTLDATPSIDHHRPEQRHRRAARARRAGRFCALGRNGRERVLMLRRGRDGAAGGIDAVLASGLAAAVYRRRWSVLCRGRRAREYRADIRTDGGSSSGRAASRRMRACAQRRKVYCEMQP